MGEGEERRGEGHHCPYWQHYTHMGRILADGGLGFLRTMPQEQNEPKKKKKKSMIDIRAHRQVGELGRRGKPLLSRTEQRRLSNGG